MLTGKQFVVAINEGGVAWVAKLWQQLQETKRFRSAASAESSRRTKGRGGEGCGLNDIFSGGRRRSVRLLISRTPQQKQQHTARANDEADKKCVDSSFSTMGIVLGSRVKAGWEERGVWVRHGYRLFLSILKSS